MQQLCVEWVELTQHTLDIAFAHVSKCAFCAQTCLDVSPPSILSLVATNSKCIQRSSVAVIEICNDIQSYGGNSVNASDSLEPVLVNQFSQTSIFIHIRHMCVLPFDWCNW